MKISDELRAYLTEEVLAQIDKLNLQYVYDCVPTSKCIRAELTELLMTDCGINPLTYMRWAVPREYAWRSKILDEVFIPSHIQLIDCSAFAESSVKKVHIAEGSCRGIGSAAFYHCASLTKVAIPDTVNYIGSNCFDGCHNLTTVYLGNGIKSFHQGAFNNCDGFTIHYAGTEAEWRQIDGVSRAFVQSWPTIMYEGEWTLAKPQHHKFMKMY